MKFELSTTKISVWLEAGANVMAPAQLESPQLRISGRGEAPVLRISILILAALARGGGGGGGRRTILKEKYSHIHRH